MAIQTYKLGAGAVTGHRLVTAPQLDHTGDTWYVHSVTGTDAVAPAGHDRKKPLATLSQAHTNAAAGDVIIFLEGHEEANPQQLFDKDNLILVGEGTGPTRPRFTKSAENVMWDLFGVVGIKLFNLYFPQSVIDTNTDPKIDASVTNTWIEDCQFDSGPIDLGPAIRLQSGADFLRVSGCNFVSTSGSNTSQPAAAVQNTGNLQNLVFDNCTFDGGVSGWADGIAADFTAVGGITGLTILDVSLLSSDISIGTSTRVAVTTKLATGSSKVF